MSGYNPDRDLRIVAAMAAQVERYLVEEPLYWPVAGRVRGGMPHLTVGGLLLRLHRLDALRSRLDPAGLDVLDAALAALQNARQGWPTHYDRKIAQEWTARVGLLRDFLRDCEHAARDCLDDWPNRAEQRTILHHLAAEAQARRTLTDAQRADLAAIDRDLRRFLLSGSEGAFLWSADLSAVYPRDPYWWLWVAPPTEEDLEARRERDRR